MSRFPHKNKGRGGWLARKFHSRSKFSISIEISNFFDLWALWAVSSKRSKPTQIRTPSWETPQWRTCSRRGGVHIRLCFQQMSCAICEPADPLQGSKSTKPGKEGFGVKKTPISGRPRKGRFESKNPHFSTKYFWTQNALFWGDRKSEFFWPRNPLFPVLWILAPVEGQLARNAQFENPWQYRLPKGTWNNNSHEAT